MALVYRVYDSNGVLLYVGKTVQGWKARLAEHKKYKSKWLGRMCLVKLRSYSGDCSASAVEARAISLLNPEFNVRGRREQRAAELDLLYREYPEFMALRFRGEPMQLLQQICGPQKERVRETIDYRLAEE